MPWLVRFVCLSASNGVLTTSTRPLRPISHPFNLQIEHHLFPGISQYYYPAIAPLVVQTCKEYGIPYRCVPTRGGAEAG